MFGFKRNPKRAVVAAAADDVVTRAEQILADALLHILFEALEQCIALRDDPSTSPLLVVRIDAALDQTADALESIIGGEA
jgi:hypothetical protein